MGKFSAQGQNPLLENGPAALTVDGTGLAISPVVLPYQYRYSAAKKAPGSNGRLRVCARWTAYGVYRTGSTAAWSDRSHGLSSCSQTLFADFHDEQRDETNYWVLYGSDCCSEVFIHGNGFHTSSWLYPYHSFDIRSKSPLLAEPGR